MGSQVAVVQRFLVPILLVLVVAACGTGGGTASLTVTGATPSTAAPGSVVPSSLAPTASASGAGAAWELVAVGDSILFNSPDDCPGCTSAVDRYAEAMAAATGRVVNVRNLTEHTGLQLNGLLNELERDTTRRGALAAADVILVGIAHNDAPMNRDNDPCDGAGGEFPDWSKFTADCVAEDVATYTPLYASAYEQIAMMRAGKPTILRTINRYNDWIGWPGHDLSAEGVGATSAVVAAWNEMICGAAETHGFACADISVKFNGEDGTEPARDLLAADYTHPSQKGNEVIAQVLVDLGFEPLWPS